MAIFEIHCFYKACALVIIEEHSETSVQLKYMISKVESVNINSKITAPKEKSGINMQTSPSFTGLGDLALRGIQYCEQKPMINVAVLDMLTAILPRTFFETFIGSKQKDENGNELEGRKLNVFGGFEAFRRESSGLLINCIIPGFIVAGAAKLFKSPVMGSFKKSDLTSSWADGYSIEKVKEYYLKSTGKTPEQRMYNTLKSMFNDVEGVRGDIDNGGLYKFKDVLKGKKYENELHKMAKNIVSKNPEKGFSSSLYNYIVKSIGIAENIRFVGETSFNSGNLSHLCDSAGELLHGVHKEGIKTSQELTHYFKKANNLVNVKSLAGLGVIIPLAISAQPINRWITHKLSGRKGAPIYNDDKERVLNSEEKKKLTTQKFFAVPLMAGVAALSMLLDRPSKLFYQFKGIFPTMDQARIISAATFSSRIAASEDSNELQETTIRDIATFSSFYFLGDYAAKAIASFLEKHNNGISLINRLKNPDKNANVFQKFWNWVRHTKIKSSDELEFIKDKSMRLKTKNLRALCHLGNIGFSLLSLGVFIPLYTRTQTNKKNRIAVEKQKEENLQKSAKNFSARLINNTSPTFSAFMNKNQTKKAV